VILPWNLIKLFLFCNKLIIFISLYLMYYYVYYIYIIFLCSFNWNIFSRITFIDIWTYPRQKSPDSTSVFYVLQVDANFRYSFISLDSMPGFNYHLFVIIRFLVSSSLRGRPVVWCSPTLQVIWSEIFLHRVSSCQLFLLPSWWQGCSVVIRPSRVTFLPISRLRFFDTRPQEK